MNVTFCKASRYVATMLKCYNAENINSRMEEEEPIPSGILPPLPTSVAPPIPSNTAAIQEPSPWFNTVANFSTGDEGHGASLLRAIDSIIYCGIGQSLMFSPFDGNKLAISTGGDYGLIGPGRIFVLERNSSGQWEPLLDAEYRDNLLDICWSHTDPNILTTGAGDGFIQVWNLSTRFPTVPVHEFKGHKVEISSVEWSPAHFGNTLLAASWDGTVCCYDMNGPWPLLKMNASELIVYQALCVSQDGIMQHWDMRTDNQKPKNYISVCETELLACDWSTFSEHCVGTAGADCSVKVWDLRNASKAISNIIDHGHAVRRVKFSPFNPTVYASVSYDMSLRVYDFQACNDSLEVIVEHTEFIYGLDWNRHFKNEMATCAWDRTVKILTPKSLFGT